MARRKWWSARRRQQSRRQQDQHQSRQHGHAQRRQLHWPAPIQQAGTALPCRRPEGWQGPPAKEVEEVGPVVGGRADIEAIVGDEGGTVRPGQRGDFVEQGRFANKIEPVSGFAGHARVPAEVEGQRLRKRIDSWPVRRSGNGVRRTSSSTPSQLGPGRGALQAWRRRGVRVRRARSAPASGCRVAAGGAGAAGPRCRRVPSPAGSR